uniref:AlNc14C122G6707 protein n=1 Tax=Albugo laibachii Nc14 TaxID=890382 RepID=F0WJI2_9STRA|nr:AlNc14C122G6707 [Albugo laibachii Nc14]|eukprot:CCA21431.1 AlNc14C122G6707 [Albugo laibachii Nc14]
MPPKKHTYSMRVKRDVLVALRQHSQRAVARRYNIPRNTLRYWIGEEDNIRGFADHEHSKSRKRSGFQSISFAGHILMYMKDQRREEKVAVYVYLHFCIK